MSSVPQTLKPIRTLGLGKITSQLLSTPSFLYDHFLTLEGWLETNEAEVSRRLLDPPALGVVDITCKKTAFDDFYIGGILQWVNLKGVNKIIFKAKKNVPWRSLIGIDCIVTKPRGITSAYVKYQVLSDEYKTWEIDNIGITEPIEAVWITASHLKDTRISVDMIRLEA